MKNSEKVAVGSLLVVAIAAILVAYYETTYNEPTKDPVLTQVAAASVPWAIQCLLEMSLRSIKPAPETEFCLATTLIVTSLMTAEYLNQYFSLLFTGAILALGNSLLYLLGVYGVSTCFIERASNRPTYQEEGYRKTVWIFALAFLFAVGVAQIIACADFWEGNNVTNGASNSSKTDHCTFRKPTDHRTTGLASVSATILVVTLIQQGLNYNYGAEKDQALSYQLKLFFLAAVSGSGFWAANYFDLTFIVGVTSVLLACSQYVQCDNVRSIGVNGYAELGDSNEGIVNQSGQPDGSQAPVYNGQ